MLKVLLRVKAGRAYLVSDATPLAGCLPGMYTQPLGGTVRLDENGRLALVDQPEILAGSATPLKDPVARMVAHGMGDLWEIWDLASIRPAQFWNRPTAAGLNIGAPADLVRFKLEGNLLTIGQTMKRGAGVYERGDL